MKTLAAKLGSHERRLSGILRREYATADIYAADVLLTRYGRPVDVDGVTVYRVEDLWPALDG